MINKKSTLGKTNLHVSQTSFGAWGIGGGEYGKVAHAQATATIAAYLDAGGNHIDTAQGYSDSEAFIGQFNTKDIIISSKTKHDGNEKTIGDVRKSLENTLKSLNRDWVDVYYMHWPPEENDNIDRLFYEYQQFQKEGKIRFIGASIKGPDVTDATTDLCRKYILDGRVDVIQLVYSIFRQKNGEILDLAKAHNIGIVGRTSLESGFLTGKYPVGHRFPDYDHRSRWDLGNLDLVLGEVENLTHYAQEAGYTLPQLAVKFAMETKGIDCVVLGAKSPEQMAENLKIEGLPPLSPEQIAYLKTTYGDFTPHCNTI